MAQVTLYLPDELERQLRLGAKRLKKSLSAYVAELATKRLQPEKWPKEFLGTFGGWKGPAPENLRASLRGARRAVSCLVDTNVCIGWLNGDLRIKKRWLALAPSELRLCSVVKAELLFGARKSARVDENLKSLHLLFSVLSSVPFDDDGAHWYGLLRAELEREGRPVGPNDLMIAATALANDLVVVTRNTREFHRVPGLRVEEW